MKIVHGLGELKYEWRHWNKWRDCNRKFVIDEVEIGHNLSCERKRVKWRVGESHYEPMLEEGLSSREIDYDILS